MILLWILDQHIPPHSILAVIPMSYSSIYEDAARGGSPAAADGEPRRGRV